jgi:sugar lactone lactonase YvrE
VTDAPPLSFRILPADPADLGEGPLWDADRGRLWFVDIEGREIRAIDADGRDVARFPAPDRPTALGLTDRGRLIVSLAYGVAFFDPANGAFTRLAEVDTGGPETRLNDGKIGPDGAFWVGAIDEMKPRRPVAKLWRVTGDGRVETRLDGLVGSNGLAWSADGRTMFHSDSSLARIERRDFDPATGAFGEAVRIATLADADGRPDGGACDLDGGYWSAGVSAGVLNHFDRDGHLVDRIPLPVAAPTMPCFGGADGRRLFLTSLKHGLSAERLAKGPASGAVLAAEAPVAGVPPFLFREA